MKKIAVIVAGGNGTRMNSNMPKQFLLIHGKPVIFYTINAFINAYQDIEMVLVLPEDYMYKGKAIIDEYFPDNNKIRITSGGKTRFHSVQNGLKYVEEESVVFVHDAVRCLISTELIKKCYDAAINFGSAIPIISTKDSIRFGNENYLKVIDRNTVKLVQTPQVFLSSILLPAFKSAYEESFTDEATVVESNGVDLYFIEGEEHNVKITTPIDLKIAELLI